MNVLASGWNELDGRAMSSSFDRLFLEEYPRVVRIAFGILRDRDKAEDVAQEVFLSFHRRHRAHVAYAAPWLHRAAAHLALNALRGDARRKKREQVDELEQQPVRASQGAALNPLETIEQAEERAEVQAALARLRPKSAMALILRHSGFSYAEIAAALGVSSGQVGTRLRRAEAALRKEITHETHR